MGYQKHFIRLLTGDMLPVTRVMWLGNMSTDKCHITKDACHELIYHCHVTGDISFSSSDKWDTSDATYGIHK